MAALSVGMLLLESVGVRSLKVGLDKSGKDWLRYTCSCISRLDCVIRGTLGSADCTFKFNPDDRQDCRYRVARTSAAIGRTVLLELRLVVLLW